MLVGCRDGSVVLEDLSLIFSIRMAVYNCIVIVVLEDLKFSY